VLGKRGGSAAERLEFGYQVGVELELEDLIGPWQVIGGVARLPRLLEIPTLSLRMRLRSRLFSTVIRGSAGFAGAWPTSRRVAAGPA
jgi:hypothetical protein